MIETKETKQSLKEISLMCGYPYDEIKKIFEIFNVIISIKYSENSFAYIPFIGSLDILYKGDELKKEGKQAILETHIDADPMLKKTIGQIEDGEMSDVEKFYFESIRNSLEKIVDEDNEKIKK